ncbi:hypothetical protein ES703_26734 [subsurface metagenome]
MTWEYHSTYRGIEIMVWMPGSTHYTAYFDGDWHMAAKRSTLKAKIDDYLGPEPKPEPDEDYLVETYRDVEIWWKAALNAFWAQVAVGYIATAPTLPEIKEEIDEILDFLEPPEDPDEGLLAQVIAAVQVWVNEVIGDRLQPVYDWIDTVLAGAEDAWEALVAGAVKITNDVSARLTTLATEVGDRWDNFTEVTLPGIWDTVDDKLGILKDAVREDLADLGTAIDTKLANLATYVDEQVAAVDTVGFFEDPVSYISGVFAVVGLLRENKIIESFLAGFEEGLDDG